MGAFPKSVAELYNLQTLRMLDQRYSPKFPQKFNNLINLRHLEFSQRIAEVPIGIGRMTNLQTLPEFTVGYKPGQGIEELAGLNQLRGKLIISNLGYVRGEEAKKANLVVKKNIYKLRYEWASVMGRNVEDVLEGLKPPPELESLEIASFRGVVLPSWMSALNNLKEIRLVRCKGCERVPALSHLPNLSSLEIDWMHDLKSLGPEFYGCDAVLTATSKDKWALFPALNKLRIKGTPKLIEWMEAPVMATEKVAVFACLEEPSLWKCEKLTNVPLHFPSLRELKIVYWSKLSNVPNRLERCTSLEIINVPSLPSISVHGLAFSILEIQHCDELTRVSVQVSSNSLHSVKINGCRKLRYLPDDWLQGAVSLEMLTIEDCPNLETIPSLHNLTSLNHLIFCDCGTFTGLPSGLTSCTSLETLRISGLPNLESIPSLDNLTSLSELEIFDCMKLKYMPTGPHWVSTTRLKHLVIDGFLNELDSFPVFPAFSQLERLTIYGWDNLKSLPQQIQHFASLTCLEIYYFHGMEALPEWLGDLTSLTELEITHCRNPMYLPAVKAMQRLTKLISLQVYQCPLLIERCAKESGPEWPKISHIPECLAPSRQPNHLSFEEDAITNW